MKCSATFLALGLLALAPLGGPQGPPLTGVEGVAGIRLFAADVEKSRRFYAEELGLPVCQSEAALCFQVSGTQQIELDSASGRSPASQLEFVSFVVRDAEALRRYMARNGKIQVGNLALRTDGSKVFDATDPEGHVVRFVEYPGARLEGISKSASRVQVSRQIIHVGYVVEDQGRMDGFYRDLLGFHPYWHGGRTDGETSWVAMQVSGEHGTEWIEYMLHISPNADHHTLGVMNHLALGVPDIQAAKAQLIKNGWKPSEEPKIGRDGKWQLNVYDPDDTRVEFMEFTPKQKPCCSEFTGPHPGPQP